MRVQIIHLLLVTIMHVVPIISNSVPVISSDSYLKVGRIHPYLLDQNASLSHLLSFPILIIYTNQVINIFLSTKVTARDIFVPFVHYANATEPIIVLLYSGGNVYTYIYIYIYIYINKIYIYIYI
jgi:hypothetical protein